MSARPPEEPSAVAPNREERDPRRALMLGARIVAVLAMLLLALVLGVVAFAFNPPSELLRRAAVPAVRRLLKHHDFELGALILRPASHIELRDLLLGPPKGYSRPLLRLGSLVVRYDLSTLIRGEVTVRKIQLERPVVHLEKRDGKSNWQAFLEGLSSGEPEPEPEPDKAGGLPDIRVRLDRISIIGLAAALDDGKRRVVLDSVNLALHGLYSPTSSDVRLRLTIEPRDKQTSLTLKQGEAKERVEADLDTRLDLEVRLKDLHRPRLDLELALDIKSQRLHGPVKLAPVTLALRLGAEADVGKDRLQVRNLGLTLAGEPLLSVQGKVEQLTGARELDMLLRRLRLPLDKLAPYAAAFFPGVELGGLLEVRDLSLKSSQAELEALVSEGKTATPPALPWLSGTVHAEGVRAVLPKNGPLGMALRIKDLDLELALAAGGASALTEQQVLESLPPAATSPAPGSLGKKGAPVALLGRLQLGSFTGAGATVRGLALRLSAGAGLDGGLAPGPAAVKAALSMARLTYTSPATGRLSLGLHAEAWGSAHLGQRRARLARLDLRLPGLLRARLEAGLEGWGRKSLQADLRLWPLDLQKIVAWLPPGLRAPLGKARPSGTVELKARARGRLPGSGPLRPLDLPLDLDLTLGLDRIGLKDPGRKLNFSGLGGELKLKVRSNLLRLDGELALASLAKPDLALDLKGLTFTPRVNVTRRQLKADLALGLEQVHKADLGLTSRGLLLKQRLVAALPMDRLIAGRAAPLGATSSQTTLSVDQLKMALPANTITLDKQTTTLSLTLDPGRASGSTLSLKSSLARARHEEQGLLVTDLDFRLDDKLSGHGGISLPKPRVRLIDLDSTHTGSLSLGTLTHQRSGARLKALALKMSGEATGFSMGKAGVALKRLTHKLALTLDSLALRKVVDRPLRTNRLDLDLTMDHLKDLKLHKLALRVPSRGVYLDLAGQADDLFPMDTSRLPRFNLKADVGLENPKHTEEAAATFLVPGVRAAGKLGVTLGLGSSDGERLFIKGRLLADSFHLWQRGGASGQASRMELKDLNARIPFSQQLLLRGGRFQLPAPRKQLTGLAQRSTLYPELRPFTRKATGLTLGGLVWEKDGLKGKQRLQLDRAELDLTLEDNALRMRRLYLKLFGGDIAGSLQAQVISLAPLDLVLHLRSQVTGVNLAYLDREAKVYTKETEVSALLNLSYRPSREELTGRVEITSLSLKMLDSLLAYMDPDQLNPSVQSNRKLLTTWYMRWINPRVRQVSLWIRLGNLNMDISMDAWFVVGTILQRVLKDMRVRRLNILPMLRREVTPLLRKAERALGGVRTKPAKKRGAAVAGVRTKKKRAKP